MFVLLVIVGNGQILQWDLNGQNQHFAELRQKVCLYIHTEVLLRGLPSLDGKNELFVGKKRKKLLAKSSQTDYIHMSNQMSRNQRFTIFFSVN